MATEVVKIVDPDNGAGTDYTSLSAWEAGEQKNLVAADEIAVADCRCTSGSADTTAVVGDGWTTDSTRYIKIWTDPNQGYRHDGKWSTSAYRLDTSADSTPIQNYEDYLRIEGLQINNGGGGGNTDGINAGTGAGEIRISHCVIKANGSANRSGIQAGPSSLKIWNCIIYDFDDFGIRVSAGTAYIYNVTVVDINTYAYSYGINNGGGTVTVKNCITQNCGNDSGDGFVGTFTDSSDYNVSSDETAPGSNSQTNVTVTFVDAANDDFHLDSSDTVAKDAGTDLSSDTYLAFSDDIDGNTRSGTWDIGADEYVSSGQSASLSDSLGLSETFNALGNYKASLSDSMNLTGSRSALGKYNRSLSDDMNFSETSTPIGHFLRAISDTLNTTDTLSVLASLKASSSDTLNLTDSVTVVVSLKGSLSDTLTFTDNLNALLKALASLSDILTLIDSITYPSGQAASLSDTLSFSDTSAAKAAFLAAISDVFTLTDTSSALAKLKAALSDTFNFSDEITTKLIGNLIDTLTLTDSATNVGHFLTAFADTLTLTDSTSGVVHFKVSLSDTLTFSEQISALASYAAVIIDTLNLTDEIAEVSITITGRLTVTFTSRKPTMVFTSRKPTMVFTSRKPTITLS